MSFTFSRNMLDLEIEGKTFSIDPFGENVMFALAGFQDKMDKSDAFDAPTAENTEQLRKDAETCIEGILGPGTYEAIFSGRAVNILDHWQLVIHLMSCVTAFRQKRVAEFTQEGIKAAERVMGLSDPVVH